MPAGDRTGPVGYGPMTGRAAGLCTGYGAPGYANPAFGRGRGLGLGFRGGRGPGFGRGFGFGRRWGTPYGGAGYYPAPAAPAPQDELSALRHESEYLKSELDNINQRISELQSATEK